MLCEILKVGELRKSDTHTHTRTIFTQCSAAGHSPLSHLTSSTHHIFRMSLYTVGKQVEKSSSQTNLPTEMHIFMCTKIQTTLKYTHSLPVKMKAAIMLSNCAAGSSLFSDAPRPHRAPFGLICRLWEADCAEKEMLCPRPL